MNNSSEDLEEFLDGFQPALLGRLTEEGLRGLMLRKEVEEDVSLWFISPRGKFHIIYREAEIPRNCSRNVLTQNVIKHTTSLEQAP